MQGSDPGPQSNNVADRRTDYFSRTGRHGNIPLFSNLRSSRRPAGSRFTNATNNYRIDAILTMAESKGLLKILSRPRVVTQNNITAVVKQGFRIPVVTAPSWAAHRTDDLRRGCTAA